MSEEEKIPSVDGKIMKMYGGREIVKIPLLAYMDMYMALYEEGNGAQDFLLDFFPSDMSDKDEKLYWGTYNFIGRDRNIKSAMNDLKARLKEMGKWK